MGVGEKIRPDRAFELQRKLKDQALPIEQVMREIKAHLGKEGTTQYKQAVTEAVVVGIPTRCIVFLICGAFECAGENWTDTGFGYPVSDVGDITLQPETAVVIIGSPYQQPLAPIFTVV
jgi:hypothetical protein